MEKDFETFDPQQSLRIIRETIDVAKKSVGENGFYFLLWGVLTAGASLADWYIENTMHPSSIHGLPWLAMLVIGFPATFIYGWLRRKRGEKPDTIVSKWYGWVWAAFGVSLAIVLPMAGASRVSPVPFVLVLAAFATFLSGVLLQFKPLRLGGLALWAGAVLCFWVAPANHPLVEAVFIVLGYIVPGLLLNKQYREQQNHGA